MPSFESTIIQRPDHGITALTVEKKMKDKTINLLQDEKGLTTVEYAVAGALIAAALVVTFQTLGLSVAGVLNNMAALVNP